jgi:hypothetical protein
MYVLFLREYASAEMCLPSRYQVMGLQYIIILNAMFIFYLTYFLSYYEISTHGIQPIE